MLKLSTAFENIESLKLYQDSLPLELIVHVYNINQGRNSEILKKCKTLESYSIFINKIRELNKDIPLDESVKAAVKYCIENDILKSFLRNHGSEVINMLNDDITVDELVAIRSKEAWEDGRENERFVIARNLIAKGSTKEFVCDITGLAIDEIENITV
ncbi:MAG: hypothetical protein FWC06_08045 [Treponema sp.]|nr:hypothetical protein [Treponema sp.]